MLKFSLQKLFIFIIVSIIALNVKSQSLKTSIDTSTILIGQSIHLKVSYTNTNNGKSIFPLIADSIGKFELTEPVCFDTVVDKASNRQTITQKITITSFDSGMFIIPSIPILIQSTSNTLDTLFSESFAIKVKGVLVDTTKDIKDIKAPVELPFSLKEILPELIIGICIIAIIILIIYYIKRRNKNRSNEIPKVDPLKAHEIALIELEKLEKEKLWQQGRFKFYHIQLTDILRTYIEQRFNDPALEQTTDEIIDTIKLKIENPNELENLKYMLKLADLVKFAKYEPQSDENEKVLRLAYDFVLNTKLFVEEKNENIVNKGGQDV